MIYSWLQDNEFAWPMALWLLLLLPVMTWWYLKKSKSLRATLKVPEIIPFTKVSSWKSKLYPILFVLRLLSVAFIILAIARPQKRNDQQLVSGEGIDIILCMDVSGSMLAQDFSPNRLEAAKNVAVNFVDARPTDRIGLVIFSGESFTSSPLTIDKDLLKSQIYNAQSNVLADGTAIGDGLSTSVQRLKESKSKSRIIILLTDGENQGGLIDPLTAKEIAKSVGIKVYTIGMGTDGFAPAPTQTSTGAVVMQQQKVNIDETLLRQIAAETGGLYFRARDNNSLSQIYSEIDKLEKTRIEVTNLRRFSEQYQPLVLIALGFLILELLLRYTLFRRFP
ncbi:MAG: vWA domain-containing protein [Flavitalea sp.]